MQIIPLSEVVCLLEAHLQAGLGTQRSTQNDYISFLHPWESRREAELGELHPPRQMGHFYCCSLHKNLQSDSLSQLGNILRL